MVLALTYVTVSAKWYDLKKVVDKQKHKLLCIWILNNKFMRVYSTKISSWEALLYGYKMCIATYDVELIKRYGKIGFKFSDLVNYRVNRFLAKDFTIAKIRKL